MSTRAVGRSAGRLLPSPAVRIGLTRSGVVAAVLVLATVTTACGDTDQASLCPVYREYLTVLQPVLAADPTAATAADAAQAVDDVLGAVRSMREVTEGRYTAPVDQLEVTLDDLRRTLASVDGSAEYATWQPLVEDSIDDALDAAARVDEEIGPGCSPGS